MGGEGIYNYFSIAPALVPFYPFSVIFLNQVIIPSFHVCPCVCCMYMYACVAVVWCGVVAPFSFSLDRRGDGNSSLT